MSGSRTERSDLNLTEQAAATFSIALRKSTALNCTAFYVESSLFLTVLIDFKSIFESF